MSGHAQPGQAQPRMARSRSALAGAWVARPGIRIALRLAMLLVLFALLFRLLDGPATLAALARAEAAPILLGLVLVQLQIVLSALRWKLTAGRLGVPLPLPRAVREYYVASFLNQVLPGGVAGDAVRTYRNRIPEGAARADWRGVLRSVVLERAAGQCTFFVIALGGLASWPLLLPVSVPDDVEALVAVPVAVFAVLAGAVALVAAKGAARWRRAFADLGPDLRRVFVDRGAWAVQPGLSACIIAGYVAVFVSAGAALGIAIPAIAWFTLIPLALLAMLVPVSIGGWGLREGAAVALFPLIGINASLALAIAILYGLINLAGSLPGLAVLALARRPGAAGSGA